jgi:hypothetical protein
MKKSMVDAVRKDPSLKALAGEVKVNVSVTKDGYLNRLRAVSVDNPKLNNLLILAINNNSPYPTLPLNSELEEQELSFSLFF